MDKLSFPEAQTPQIRVESWSNSARILQVRGFTRDGTLSHDHTTSSDRSLTTTSFDVSNIPAMLQVSPAAAPVRRGECYVRVTLLMGGFAVGRLIAGYVTDGMTLAWPGGRFENFTDGPGLIRSILGTDPAAGVDITEVVPTNARWKLLSYRCTLVTDDTVADRTLRFVIDDGASWMIELPAGAVQTASLARIYLFAPGLAPKTAFNVTTISEPLPEGFILFQGYRANIRVTNQQAGDDLSAPRFQVEEWIEE